MKRSLLALLLACSFLVPVAGQQPAAPVTSQTTQKPTPVDADEVVRITTNLVQIDAVVTDRAGRQITDLGPDDFEVYEDGHKQQIKNLSYVTLQPDRHEQTDVAAAAAAARKDPTAMPVPPVQLRPEQVRRTIALVVDDLGLSFESTHFVRNALHKFVDEQMQPGDLVAVIRTGAGVGALQQFTTDRQLLHAAIDRVRWNASGRAGIRAFGAIGDDSFHITPESNSHSDFTRSPQPEAKLEIKAGEMLDTEKIEQATRVNTNEYREELFTIGTLGALNFVVRGLKELPGRKSVVLMSDALEVFNANGNNFRTAEGLHRLIDFANRASVVFYTIDARGLLNTADTAANSLSGVTKGSGGQVAATGLPAAKIMQELSSRSLDILVAQEGMSYLADQTGGFLVRNNNDIAQGIGRVLNDQKGYYLIGYRPDEATFDPATGRRSFHQLAVRVKHRPELNVRTRAGFYGIATEDTRPVAQTRAQQLLSAITSPFASGALDLRLTSLFLNDPDYGSFVRSLIHVNGDSLTFTDEPDGGHKASVDVVAMTFDDTGTALDQRLRTETVVVRGDEYKAVQRNGLTFGINLPIKKPGAFQLRVAVRDAATERVGAANQFIEVPNLKKKRLTLSGLYLASNAAQATLHNVAQAAAHTTTPPGVNAAEGQIGEQDPQAGPAVRRFRPGMVIDYGYEAYNVRRDSASDRPRLQTQVRLFHENQQVFTGKVLTIAGQPGAERVVAFGHLQLGQNLPPGDYVLQVIVADLATGKSKPRPTAQWLPFEIN